jgi:hypothetical protein
VLTEGGVRKLYKSKSLIDRGEGKVTPPVGDAYFPLFAPVYIGRLGGQTYNRWFAFDDNEWECNCKDPYDNIDQWRVVQKLPFTGWSIDFEIFQNSQPGPFQNKTYLLWAGADTPPKGWWFESVFAAELLDLRPGTKVLSTYDNNDQNRVVSYGFDWTDVIAEAPAPAIRGNSVSVVYSGNGAQTDDYALGVAMLKAGTNPAEGSNWINYNRGACDGDSRRAPEFAKTDGVFGPGVARFTKSRQIHAQPIGWRDVACGGASYTIPNLGKPVPPPGCS